MSSLETAADFCRLLNSLPSLVGYWDKESRCRYANRAYEVWLGVAPGELLGRHVDDFIIPPHREKLRLRIDAVLRGEPQHYVRALEWPNFSGSGRVDLIPDLVQGQIQGFFVHVTDSSSTTTLKLMALKEGQALALQRAHERLAQSDAALRQAQRLGQIGSWELELESGEVIWSEGLFILYGFDPALGQLAYAARKSFHSAENWRRLRQAVDQVRADGEPRVLEHDGVLRSGAKGWFESRFAAVRDGTGAIVKVIGTVQDVTHRHVLEEARAARQSEEESSRNKSAFLARMSHELRTPLNAVLGFSQLLEFDDAVQAAPDAVAKVGHIRLAAEHLLSMVDDLLDMTRIETGTLRLTAERVSVDALLVDCRNWVAALVGHHRVSVHQQPVPEDHWVIGDRTRLRQVLVNLLTNAIKYNHEGGSVEIERTFEAGRLAIMVRDTGVGMTPEQVDGLFQPFNRLGAERGQVDGIGLGLVIARHLAEQMQGTLSVASQPGRGSVFTLRLPMSADAARLEDSNSAVADGAVASLTRTTQTASTGLIGAEGESVSNAAQDFFASQPRSVQPRPVKVLYIEDNRLNATLMRHAIARRPGVTLEVAKDGEAGLAAARRSLPDLLLLDMGLPLMSGAQVLEQLRADPLLAGILCVAISANAMPADIQRALDAGCSDYIIKPYSIDRVLDWVDRLRG